MLWVPTTKSYAEPESRAFGKGRGKEPTPLLLPVECHKRAEKRRQAGVGRREEKGSLSFKRGNATLKWSDPSQHLTQGKLPERVRAALDAEPRPRGAASPPRRFLPLLPQSRRERDTYSAEIPRLPLGYSEVTPERREERRAEIPPATRRTELLRCFSPSAALVLNLVLITFTLLLLLLLRGRRFPRRVLIGSAWDSQAAPERPLQAQRRPSAARDSPPPREG